jgi:pilus assembly protein CpaC
MDVEREDLVQGRTRMILSRSAAHRAFSLSAFATLLCVISSPALGQSQLASQPVQFHVSGPAQRLEMIVNTSRIITLDYDVPRILVNNTDLIRATPLKANQIQVSALKPGVTQLNIWDDKENIQSLDVLVYGDARELQNLLASEFPEVSKLNVRPIASSVIISGFVPRPDSVSRIVRIAQDYYPNVVNMMEVGGAQQVLLHVKVMEVSRTKLRRMGVDWAALMGNDFIIQSVSGLIIPQATQAGVLTGGGDTMRFGIVDGGNTFGALLELLKQNNMAKLLAEPTLVTMSGRPARFNSGGEVPVPVPAGLGVTSIQYREFGTAVDFVPIVLGNGMIRLEVRPQITEIDNSLTVNGAPGFRSRTVDTGVEMRAGQTLALAGLIQNRVDSEVRGIPWLADMPWLGAAFRRTREQMNEVELLILVTPELVDALDPHEVPPCGPGESTTSPTDVQLYWKGMIEVPGGCNDCYNGGPGMPGPIGPFGNGMQYEQIPSGRPAPPPGGATRPKTQGGGKAQTVSQTGLQAAKKPLVRTPAASAASKTGRAATGKAAVSASGSVGASSSNNQNNSYIRDKTSPSKPLIEKGKPQPTPALFGPIGYDIIK